MEISSRLLQEYFDVVRASALYNELYAGISDYRDAPVLQKEKLQEILLSRFDLHSETRGVYLVRSGGTTQKPLIFPVDISENLEQRSKLAKEIVAAGIIQPTSIALNLFSYGLIYRTAGILDDILEKCEATSLPLSAEAKNSDVHESVLHFKPNLIMGSPSRLILFAHYLKEISQTVSIPAVLFGGEFIFPSAIPVFKERFGTQNIYAMYGSAETGIWAWCDYTADPSLYRVLDEIHIEIMEADAEGFGKVCVTNLMRKRFPVFRYEMGDIGKLVTHSGKKYLQLKSRVDHSFSIDSTKLYVEDFKNLTADAEAFQIQLSLAEDSRQILSLLLVKSIPQNGQEDYISQKMEQLKSIMHFSRSSVEMVLKLVNPDELYRNKVTAKTPLLVDFRA